MPKNEERPTSTSSGKDQGSDTECCDSVASSSDQDCSRSSFTSDCSSKHCTPSSSPPKTLTLDEVMEAAKDLINLRLAHEIAVNPTFHVSLPQDSLYKAVRDNVHRAYWDILESELNDDPPEYRHAIRLLEEIREILLSFLNPGANRMRTQIMEVLDMDLIQQQAENDAVDIQGLASYIITTMGKLCSPLRDEDIKKLRENTDNTVTLFREIFRVLDLMKMDMVNTSIMFLRPVIQSHGVEYEREQFQTVLNQTPNALQHTTSWIKSTLELLSTTIPKEQSKGQQVVPGPFQVLNAAMLGILTWDYDTNPLPETWMTDEPHLSELQQQLKQCQTVNMVLLIIYNTIGGPIQGLSTLSDRLKRMTSVLLDGMHKPNFKLEEALEGVSAQICCELNKSLTERSYPPLTSELQATLRGQICSIVQKDNPIRTLVEDRVQQYFTALICNPQAQAQLEQVPAGLAHIKPELTLVAKKFIPMVNYNKSVYGPFYADIIKKLIFNNGTAAAANPPAPDTPRGSTPNQTLAE
ncbi:uncharacterized protein V6R79_008753 [Siganus canaliculatus]